MYQYITSGGESAPRIMYHQFQPLPSARWCCITTLRIMYHVSLVAVKVRFEDDVSLVVGNVHRESCITSGSESAH